MRLLILGILMLIPLSAYTQTDRLDTVEVLVSPEFIYGQNSIYIKAGDDGAFQYNILDMDKNNVFLSGNVSSLEPMVRTGKYTFNTPEGKPYVSGFFTNNIPFRVWSYFDEKGQVKTSVNYSAAIQFMKNYGDKDIGEDYVQEAKKAPKFGKKGMKGFMSFLEENVIYPPFALINNEEGRVVCQFVVDKTGQIINVRILEGVNEDFDLEVIRLLSISPLWKPGKENGQDVNVMYTMAFDFKIPSVSLFGN